MLAIYPVPSIEVVSSVRVIRMDEAGVLEKVDLQGIERPPEMFPKAQGAKPRDGRRRREREKRRSRFEMKAKEAFLPKSEMARGEAAAYMRSRYQEVA